MGRVIQARRVDDKQGMEHDENMAIKKTPKIDAAPHEAPGRNLAVFAQKPPESDFVERPGFEDNEAHWKDVRRIADETLRDGGIPLEDVQRWVESWDTENELPPPEPRRREAE
ncbi:antitoxin [Caulobacter segnis]|uniref:Antitoxin n=1 Tax=Caulobacter segnis TaxID=88688 RepID=A0ABM6TDU5_9CAUL|nr:hypothetical protein [Caulobacter segnis]AVQ01258.1 antitoxin [Caulobacter segnis]